MILRAGLIVMCEDDAAATTTPAPDASADAPENFLTVRPGLYRGGHVDLEISDYIEATLDEIAFEPALSDRFDEDHDAIAALLATATPAEPIDVDCKHGKPADAHAEMVTIGFHTYFAGLEEYFENKTGWEDD